MYIRIYFDDKPLFLCDDIDDTIEPYMHHDDAVFIDELNAHTVKAMIHEMQQEKVHAGIFFYQDFEALKSNFFKKFKLVTAAGGLVENEAGAFLLIFRRGFWDLPKGKLDEGEELEACAIREVEEETGLNSPVIIQPLVTTYHTYHEGTRFFLKESHWYLMKASGTQELVPQQEEDIRELSWVQPGDLEPYLSQSFPSIRDVFTCYQALT